MLGLSTIPVKSGVDVDRESVVGEADIEDDFWFALMISAHEPSFRLLLRTMLLVLLLAADEVFECWLEPPCMVKPTWRIGPELDLRIGDDMDLFVSRRGPGGGVGSDSN
jgi:hypothetical protein